MKISKQSRNLNVDALKALAIIAVVFYHLGNNILPMGFLGVDIFFAISGYFIMIAMAKEHEKGEKHKYFQTLFSRIKRLWLPILLVCLVSLIVGSVVMLPDDFENLCQSVVASGVFANNILGCITTKNYWDVVNQVKPLMHLWYVGVLMQAYVVMPLLIMGVFRVCRRSRRYGVTIGGLLLVTFLLYLLPIATTAEKFYYLPFRLFEFFAGALAAVVAKSDFAFSGKKNGILAGVFVGVIVVLLVARDTIISQQFMLVSVVISTGVLLVLFAKGKQWEGKPLQWIAGIGQASFSIYLWHQVLVAFMNYCVFQELTFGWVMVFLAATGACAFISYKFLEKPLHKVKGKGVWIVLFSGGLLCIVLCGVGLLGYLRGGVIRDVPELGLTAGEAQRGVHARYNDRVYAWDKNFEDDGRRKVVVIGDSFGRDFANILDESPIAETLQISYIYPRTEQGYMEQYEARISEAEIVFYAPSGDFDRLPDWLTDSAADGRVYVVGVKNFGTSNGYVYTRRHLAGYCDMTAEIDEAFWERNARHKAQWKDHYIDMLAPVSAGDGRVRVFTQENQFISQDCRHLTMYGAQYYASVLDFSWILTQNGK